MKQQRNFPSYIVTKKATDSLKSGHPWVFEDEIIEKPDNVENGSIVDVLSEKGTYLGSGLLSESSKIRIRILSSNANEKFEKEFFERRIKYALDYRLAVMGEDFSSCRLVFGEADGLPGVTVDKYEDMLVSQILSYGMEMRKDILYSSLIKHLSEAGVQVKGIYERSESNIRSLEGLEALDGWYYKDKDAKGIVQICENGIKYNVDIEHGQKTGFFLDQKYNRLAVSKLAKGKTVLDCFTHTGSFALNAAKGGANSVIAVDVSQEAIDNARENAKINGLEDKVEFRCENVFDTLPRLLDEHAKFDFIILDPPAFTKSRRTIADAERGYKEINFRAMKILPRGGFLATCSCSHFMDTERFIRMLKSAAFDAGVTLKLIEQRRQSPDHPTLMNVPETDYLKFFTFQIN